MIAGLRKKFILISAVSVLAVFSVIFLLLALFSWDQTARTMDTLADAIASNDGVFPEFDPADRTGPIRGLPYGEVINEETRFSTRFFTAWLDREGEILRVNVDAISSISREDVAEYVQAALKEGRERGWVSGYRYRVLDTARGSTAVFVNASTHWAMTTRLLVTAFLVLLGSAGLILLLTVLLSGRVVRPVAEGYEKQRQFITDANHELKTPLTLILSNLDILESELGENEWLEDIRGEGERMRLMIDQLVALSRMEERQDHLVREPFDLSAAVADTVSEFQTLAAERDKGLRADLQPGLTYEGDEGLIRRLVSVLLDNAVKYCDPGGEIRVALCRRRHVVLTVENTYAKVGELELDRLFDRFYRADRARTFSGSFGVGLSIGCGGDGQILWFSSSTFLEDMYNAWSSGSNSDLAMNALSSLIGEREAMAIRSKSLNYNYLTISDSTASLLKVLMIGVFPLGYLGIGIGVILKRRRKQNEAG